MSYKNIMAYAFIFLMIGVSVFFNNKEIILPEMAALAVGSLIYEQPAWLAKPFHVFLLPSITAVGGFLINASSFNMASKIILALLLVLIILLTFRSTLAPAIATGLLPIITNATSLYFIWSILALTFLLFVILRITTKNRQFKLEGKPQSPKDKILYMTFISAWVLICFINGWMFIAAIPPVVVVGYESMHKEKYGFSMLYKQVLCLSVAALIGTLSLYLFSNLLLASLLDIILVSLLLQLTAFKLTPAYAMSILPIVLPGASHQYFCLEVLMMSGVVLGLVFVYKNIQYRYSYDISQKKSL